MKGIFIGYLKYFLTLIGSRLTPEFIYQLQMVVNYMRSGRWMRKHGFHFDRRVPNRHAVFNSVAKEVRDKRVLYLEFGVFRGESMRYWSRELKHPQANLHGFDSFEGLPEDFDLDGPYNKGTFNVDGTIPDINDSRVKFFKGWFDQTVPNYTIPEHDVLILMMDADLYSSTIYVLDYFRDIIKPGAFIFFDEMSRTDHEPKAFDEFMRKTEKKFKPICSALGMNRCFFQCIG
jgi:O-methyltransferase